MAGFSLPGPGFARRCIFAAVCIAALGLAACSAKPGELLNGYYTAEAADFDEYGWKEQVIICVRDNRIVSVDYDAKNASGFVKSWDMDYMRTMNAADDTYPNEYTRIYSEELLTRQDPALVDAVAGATVSHHTFQILSEAAIALAKTGDKDIAYVDLSQTS